MAILVALHVLAAVVWIGGMFFALIVLRPVAGGLDVALRGPLWRDVFRRFFGWVWAAVVLLLLTGYEMIFAFLGGFSELPIYLHLMQGIGILMVLIFLHLWFVPYRRFRAALEDGDGTAAGAALGQIRWIITVNLVLGLTNAAIGASGPYWP